MSGVRLAAELSTTASPERVVAEMADLSAYPRWAGPVRRVTPDGADSFEVELAATLGPWRRSKRLRMVRTALEADRVVFERRETDGREHSPWVLVATVDPLDDGSHLGVELSYGGRLWVPMLDRLAADTIANARSRLRERLEQPHDAR